MSGDLGRRKHKFLVHEFAGFNPLLSAPKTEVVMPDECQSIPMTEPSA